VNIKSKRRPVKSQARTPIDPVAIARARVTDLMVSYGYDGLQDGYYSLLRFASDKRLLHPDLSAAILAYLLARDGWACKPPKKEKK
jgi:hypothetical protein